MKTLKTMILSVGAVALWGTSGIAAQTGKADANIPFDFTVQNTTLPAGHYNISAASTSRGLMLIQNAEAHKAILVLAPDSEGGYARTQGKNVVVFHKVGDRYLLESVKTAAVCGQLAPSKLEREVTSAGNGQPVASVIVAVLTVR
jgi:hypothetical protein